MMKASLMRHFVIAAFFLQLLFFNCRNGSITDPVSFEPLKIDITTEGLNETLNDRIPGMMTDFLIPGLQMAVVKDDAMIWSRGFGVKNNATQAPVDNQSLFQAASLSKTVFAYAVMKLVEAGVLDLNRPLIEYATEAHIIDVFNRGNPLDERFHRITARMVLTHSTGFPNWRSRDAIDFLFEPGDRFSYSGEGFVYLQRIVEHITGKTLNEFMTERVFEPLGMTKSGYAWRETMEPHITQGHQQFGQVNPIARPEAGNAAGSLLTTAEDYVKFILAFRQADGLQEQSIADMLMPQIQVPQSFDDPSSISDSISWGLGFGLQHTEFGEAFWHWGDNGDFKCFMIMYPDEGIGLVYFTNSHNGLSIADILVPLTLGGSYPALDWLDY